MKIGYAVLENDEDINTSGKISFEKIIQLDRMFVDYGKDREEQKKMLRLIKPGNAVIFQSPDNCGMNYEEQIRLREQIITKTSDVMYFEGDNIPEIQNVIMFHDDKTDDAYVTTVENNISKKRGPKGKKLDQNEFERLTIMLYRKKITKKEMCLRLGITYPTLMRKLEQADNLN